MFTNRYIFIYSAVMVIVVAAILSSAATMLKPMQEQNIRTEKIMNILSSVNIETTKSEANDKYKQFITAEYTLNSKGDIIGVFKNGVQEQGDVRAFDIDLKVELKKAAALEAGKAKEEPNIPLFVCEHDGETYYIIPVRGTGLWGPIWGNLALKSDFRTVYGANFDHEGETPGLGAEIATDKFKAQFPGKTIFDDSYNFTSIDVVKGGFKTLPVADQVHGVDAISGGTITSKGVTAMLHDCLINYVPYIKKQI